MTKFAFLSLLVPVVLFGCSAGASDSPADGRKTDAGSDGVAMSDGSKEAADRHGELSDSPRFPTVTFVKNPWFQWPSPGRFFILAETNEETPLDLSVEWEGGKGRYSSEPTQPEFEFLGIPLPDMDGYFHQVEVVLPKEAGSVFVRVLNSDGFERNLLLPHTLNPLQMVVFGDTRVQHDQHRMVVERIMADMPALVLHTGDMTVAGAKIEHWGTYFEIEGELLSSTFLLPIFGNHEIAGEGYFEVLYQTDNNYDDTERNWWLDLGDLAIVGIQAYSTDWTADDSLLWLEETLKKLSDKRWLFFSHHEPMYTFSNHSSWTEGREYVQPLLEKYGVDMVLAGHNHCYERFEVNGISYIVTGGGGAPLYSTGDGPDDEMELLKNWGKFFHFLKLDISDEKIHVTVIEAEDGTVFEEFDVK